MSPQQELNRYVGKWYTNQQVKDRMYIEIPKDSRKAFEEFSKDSLIVKVRKVLG